jgi:hypothetical protein
VTGRVHLLRNDLAKFKRGRIDIRQVNCRNGRKGRLGASDRPIRRLGAGVKIDELGRILGCGVTTCRLRA